ncbi:SPOR domain-containing protein [Acinetobacter wanghuae]
MSMNNKQRWMGGVVLLGGGVLLAALLLKGKDEIDVQHQQFPDSSEQVDSAEDHPNSKLNSLTVDVATEKRLLEQQRRDREKSVAEQEARAAEFLAMQQQAEADAARKAAEEYAALNAHRLGQQSSDNIPPELVEDEKTKQKRLAEDKAAAQKKLEQQKAEQQKAHASTDTAKKEAEQKAALAKKKAEEQKAAEEKRKAAEKLKAAEAQKAADKKAAEHKAEEKRKADEKHKAEEAKKKAEAEKARKLLEGDDAKQWMVQVALAANEANADAIAAKLRAKGYKVTKSPTSKGVRIMVGPSKNREAADATRKKIASDASLNMKSAWVNEWVPLDKRN